MICCHNTCPSLHSIQHTPSQLHSLQQIPTQHDMLPQHLVYKNELNREYIVTLARNDETPWWWSEKIETCQSGFKCCKVFKWKLYRCICWLIFKLIFPKCTVQRWETLYYPAIIQLCISCIITFLINTVKSLGAVGTETNHVEQDQGKTFWRLTNFGFAQQQGITSTFEFFSWLG